MEESDSSGLGLLGQVFGAIAALLEIIALILGAISSRVEIELNNGEKYIAKYNFSYKYSAENKEFRKNDYIIGLTEIDDEQFEKLVSESVDIDTKKIYHITDGGYKYILEDSEGDKKVVLDMDGIEPKLLLESDTYKHIDDFMEHLRIKPVLSNDIKKEQIIFDEGG